MSRPRIGAVVLAAGSSSRMRGGHKLLARIDGQAIVEVVVSLALASEADPVVVVLGHRSEDVGALMPEAVTCVVNPAWEAGLSSSVALGIRALSDDVAGAFVMLGDMPLVEAGDLDALLDAFAPGRACVPTAKGRWGNPVLWSRDFFPRMVTLEGDRGARRLLEEDRRKVVEVPVDNPGVLVDVDTREDLERARGLR